ncbi:TPA: LOW QUALITY PROTEIN: hypothetical protein N0F65_000533 [Lagenidium giganteum]|uniref:polynucleotide adenylyltransferase n=1 Tax=Lagenidium giganteum TaxID=4803 RepID=A0AAV2Z4R9_9STRA|nr:TPA: LOW QUALITY PROTEIN: hypothetical protein N0F65_000533 [Lagenidium giganteum]
MRATSTLGVNMARTKGAAKKKAAAAGREPQVPNGETKKEKLANKKAKVKAKAQARKAKQKQLDAFIEQKATAQAEAEAEAAAAANHSDEDFIGLIPENDGNSKQAPKDAASGTPEDGEEEDKGRLMLEKMPWMGERTGYFNSNLYLNLHEEIMDFVRFLSPHPEELVARRELVNEMKDLVASIWPEATLETFGSHETQMFLPKSDIDMVLFGVPSGTAPLFKLAEMLSELGLVSYLEVVDKARIPIVKFVHKASNIQVDVSFNIASGLATADLVKHYMRVFPAFRPLVLVLKYYLSQRGLNETFAGGIGSFLLQMMVVSFLQHHRRNLSSDHDDPRYNNLGHLLVGFFSLYGKDLNYYDMGISVRNGGSYFRKEDRGWFDENRSFLLSMENPNEPSLDVAKNSYEIRTVKRSFDYARQVLLNEIHRRGQFHPLAGSILGTIIPADSDLVQRVGPKTFGFDILYHDPKKTAEIRRRYEARRDEEARIKKTEQAEKRRKQTWSLLERRTTAQALAWTGKSQLLRLGQFITQQMHRLRSVGRSVVGAAPQWHRRTPAHWVCNGVAQQQWLSTSTSGDATRQYISLYNYTPLEPATLPKLRNRLLERWNALQVLGRIYISSEGINAQLILPSRNVDVFTDSFPELFTRNNMFFGAVLDRASDADADDASKTTVKAHRPFHKLDIRIRDQIVSDGFTKALNLQESGEALPPFEWHAQLQQRNATGDESTLLLDVRNFYEHEVGRFDGATRIMVDTFRDTFDAVDEILDQHTKVHGKPEQVMMYCTGGIRCEKVGAYLTQFKDVPQVKKLKGGIVNYMQFLQANPEEKSLFKGRNFVFDQRCVAEDIEKEQVTDDVLGKCFQCGEPCNKHTNCSNLMCHGLILQCTNCATSYHGACSDVCKEEVLKMQTMTTEEQRLYRKGNAANWKRPNPNALESNTKTYVRFRPCLRFYNSTQLPEQDLPKWRRRLLAVGRNHGVLGRIYVATEGINAQVMLPVQHLDAWGRVFPELFSPAQLVLGAQIDASSSLLFEPLHVRIINHLVHDGLDASVPLDVHDSGESVDPAAWHAELQAVRSSTTQQNTLVLDVRNFYEHAVGRFDGATRIMVDTFRDTFDAVDEILDQHTKVHGKPEQVMMYCTGGIRCEKVGAYLTQVKDVPQVKKLKGGIVNYMQFLQANPEEKSLFKGRYFMVDQRCVSSSDNDNVTDVVADDMLGKCFQCGEPWNYHSNCANVMCVGVMLQCPKCAHSYHGACTEACQQEVTRLAGLSEQARGAYRKTHAAQWQPVIPNALMRSKRRPQAAKRAALAGSQSSRAFSTRQPEDPTRVELETSARPARYDKTGNAVLSDYVARMSSPLEDHALLQELREVTKRDFIKYEQLSEEPQGQLLTFLTQLARAQDVLEIGCFTGYSALCLANGLPRERGHVLSCDLDAAALAVARSFFARSARATQLTAVEQDGLACLEAAAVAKRQFDLIFVDANKRRYTAYYDWILAHGLLRPNGLMVFDNTLFRGRVVASDQGTAHKKEKIAHALAAFNAHVARDARTHQMLLPLWDGLTVVRHVGAGHGDGSHA